MRTMGYAPTSRACTRLCCPVDGEKQQQLQAPRVPFFRNPEKNASLMHGIYLLKTSSGVDCFSPCRNSPTTLVVSSPGPSLLVVLPKFPSFCHRFLLSSFLLSSELSP